MKNKLSTKPDWLKIRPPSGDRYVAMKERVRRLGLATVCEEARCPNLAECWAGGTATLMLMGDVCTRGCRFCAVKTAKRGQDLDPAEPANAAFAVQEMGLDYVVLTSVDRDDLPDGGAEHFARTVRAIGERTPDVLVEVLIPDFAGAPGAVATIVASRPTVIAHNIEVVRRLTRTIRDARCDFDRSLDVLNRAKRLSSATLTKSSIMLGLGENDAEVKNAMQDLRDADVDIVTLGQYLRPSARHAPVVEYSTPDRFDRLGDIAREMGFLYVASGPLVRSSYRAGELFVKGTLRQRKAQVS